MRVIALCLSLVLSAEGAWAGQMIGVSYGAPTEFKALGKTLEGDLAQWTPGRVSNSLGQDDLYVDMTFAKVLDDKGLDATSADFGAMFRDSKYALWHANLEGRRALRRGVRARPGTTRTPTTSISRSRPTSLASWRRACSGLPTTSPCAPAGS
jgi:hypothetical protein